MIESHDPTTTPAPEATETQGRREQGFTLIVALLVMGLLTVLGLSLLFTAETERTMARNFAGTIQATYAAEAVTEAMTRALLFDLEHDSVGGWANQYLVVCEFPDESVCNTKYGFTPTAVPCYNAVPANSCIVKDTVGSLTGVAGQWAANLAYRSTGPTTFPNQLPTRIHTDLKEVMTWWKKFDINTTDPVRLNTGTAELALASVCSTRCTTSTPTYLKNEIFVSGIGKSAKLVGGRFVSKNPSTRALTMRIEGTLHKIWKNALVGGGGGDDPDHVIKGNYVIRGGVLIFNDNAAKTALEFNAPGTGIVNNYYAPYDAVDNPIQPISSWWWLDAKGCGVGQCDSSDTTLADTAIDTTTYPGFTKPAQTLDRADVNTATVEPIGHRLPHPPDQDIADTYPGGYKAADTTNFKGPEALETDVKVNRGQIVIGSANARVGTLTGTAIPGPGPTDGHYWRNVLDIFFNDGFRFDASSANATIFRAESGVYDLHTRSGSFNLDTAIRFPKVTEPYVEPVTKEPYLTYQDFLRPVSPSTHPGSWAIDLSGIDGTTGIGRDFNTLDGTMTTWPNATSPTAAQLDAAFGTSAAPRRLYPGCLSTWRWGAGTTCGTFGIGPKNCIIEIVRVAAGAGTCPRDNSLALLSTLNYTVYRRSATTAAPFVAIATTDSTAGQLNLDSSSSIDAPKGRAQSTMFNSFAYKLYVDVLAAVDSSPCDASASTIYNNNFPSSFPAEFRAQIPTSYPNPTLNQCITRPVTNELYQPCFAERYAYMDVHIQLPDLPDLQSTGNPSTNVNGPATFRPEGRWLSVRFRPSGIGDPITVLSDPRARPNPDAASYAGGCNYRLTTDLAMELDERVVMGEYKRLRADLVNSTTDGVRWKDLALPPRYDRARPMDPNDVDFRNMPTGAFVIALHLPCSEDEGDKNPYKCTTIDPLPSIAYPGFYTHLIAWSPKFSCWRTSPDTYATNLFRATMGEAPPHIPDLTPSCGAVECPANARPISWFAQSLWQANMTTLWNVNPQLYPGHRDAGTSGVDVNKASLTGFKIAVPISIGNQTGPCGTGTDRRDQSGGTRCTAPPTTTPLNRGTCLQPFDGVACNAVEAECYETGCGFLDGDETDCYNVSGDDPGGDGLANALDPDCACGSEPDYIPFHSKAYGGCTEIFTPLVRMHNSALDPTLPPFARNDETARSTFDIAIFGLGVTPHWPFKRWCSPGTECIPTLGGPTNTLGQCMFRGIDPDLLSSWVNASTFPGTYQDLHARYVPDRWDRDWPGWPSVSYLYGAGQVFTKDGVRFGSPNRTCENEASCPTGEPINGSANACYNCGAPNNYSTTNLSWRRGYFSDPVVYDGRLILYSGDIDHTATPPAAATGKGLHNTTVWYHDHFVPRQQMGCSDFLSVLTTGDTEIVMGKPYDVTPARQLLAGFTLTGGELKVTTPNASVQHELAGSWIAEAADFGTYTNPVQIIGAPSIANSCDHVYLPGRDPYATGELISYVEDTMLPYGF